MDYWRRRRGYDRINTSNTRRKNAAAGAAAIDTAGAKSGARKNQRRRFFKFARCKKAKLRLISPNKLLPTLRDAYVNMMLRIANYSRVGGAAATSFGNRPLKEYDNRMLLHIYTSSVPSP
ncbi:PREDICTED: uncharacterized protein LOC109191250 [Ipomoea nil]|uniref:uncharacterized protein LOC109191250 n=1 Tax=Ipomoea nil TaxID=35883 RepID=UPI000900BD70|nr:PREDICTED: uncharacterized protein LOC109191250 [Ipomoea nil]